MPNPIQDKVRDAMTHGGDLDIVLDPALNGRISGFLDVYLRETGPNTVAIGLNAPGEAARILWLPWKQGELPALWPGVSGTAPANMLFFTYYLSGCKVFAIEQGPIWHIDAEVKVQEFWPRIQNEEWVEDNWAPGTSKNVAYVHRSGQPNNLWDLSAYLDGAAPSTYGRDNVGSALVGGVVGDGGRIALYMKASPWASFKYAPQRLKK